MKIIDQAEQLLSKLDQELHRGELGVVDQLLELSPDFIKLRLIKSKQRIEKKDFHSAIEETMKILKSQSDNLEALYYRALAFYQLGQISPSITHLKHALSSDPENSLCKSLFKVFIYFRISFILLENQESREIHD